MAADGAAACTNQFQIAAAFNMPGWLQLVGTGITQDPKFRAELLDCEHIDRLNLGAVPTTKLDWLQPHEGNIVDFLYRARAFQSE